MEPGAMLVHLLKFGPATNPLIRPKVRVSELQSIHWVNP
jgi:hypothetical protein